MNSREGKNRAVETVEKRTTCFSTVPTAPTTADNQQQTKTTDDRLHKMLDATSMNDPPTALVGFGLFAQ
jgi:hypothetical protein